MLLNIILGFIAAAICVFIVAKWKPNKDHAFWRSGLLIAALIYVVFALIGGRWDYVPIEIGGVILYGLFVWLSKKYALYWLAFGWTLHICWDVFLHSGTETGFVPSWYPGICLGYDIVIAGYIFWVYLKRKDIQKQAIL